MKPHHTVSLLTRYAQFLWAVSAILGILMLVMKLT